MQVAVAGVAEVADGNALRLAGCTGVDEKFGYAVNGNDNVQLVKKLSVGLNDGEERAARRPNVLFKAVCPNNERVVCAAFFGKLAEAIHLRGKLRFAVADQSHEYIRAGLLAVYNCREHAVASESRRGINDVALHEFYRLRIEVCKLYLRNGGDCRFDVGKGENEAHVHVRLGNKLERKLGYNAERAFRADHQVQQTVARACFANGLAQIHNLSLIHI